MTTTTKPRFAIGQAVLMHKRYPGTVTDVQRAAACEAKTYGSKWLYEVAEPGGTNTMDVAQRDLQGVR